MFNEWQQYLQTGLATALERGEEFGVVEADEILPYSSELRFLSRINEFTEQVDNPLILDCEAPVNLHHPRYIAARSKILNAINSMRPNEAELTRMLEIRHLSWEYTRNLNSAAYDAYHLSGRQEVLSEGAVERHRNNARDSLRRLVNIRITANNLRYLLRQLTEIREDNLYRARDCSALAARIRANMEERRNGTLRP
jgi:hypothetical protein